MTTNDDNKRTETFKNLFVSFTRNWSNKLHPCKVSLQTIHRDHNMSRNGLVIIFDKYGESSFLLNSMEILHLLKLSI